MKAVRLLLFVTLVTLFMVTPVLASGDKSTERPDLSAIFARYGVTGCFVMCDSDAGTCTRVNPSRCAEGFLPASTFKILNSLIALETGVAPDDGLFMKWNGTNYPIPAWNRDQTMLTAFRNSVVWYYQELARRIGPVRMAEWVDKAGYGNRDIGGELDSFWLRGDLRISADEQVEFLKRLYDGSLPFSTRVERIVVNMMQEESAKNYVLRGKTGMTKDVAWHVGWVERFDRVCFFAMNFTPDKPGVNMPEVRGPLLRELLKATGAL